MAALVIAEHDNKVLKDATAKTVTAASQLGAGVHILVAGHNCGAVAEAAAKLAGVEKVIVADDALYAKRSPRRWRRSSFRLPTNMTPSWRRRRPTEKTLCRAWPRNWTPRRFPKS